MARHLRLLSPHPLRVADGPLSERLILAFVLAANLLHAAQPSTARTPPPATSLAPSVITAAPRSVPFHTDHLPGQTPSKADCLLQGQILSNLDLQLKHSACCRTPVERDLLRIVKEKVTAPIGTSYGKYWAQPKAWRSYDKTASIVICSGYAGREDFARCGYCSFQCLDRLLCPRCSHTLARRALDEFGNSFGADQEVWFIVTSLSADPDESHRFIFRDMGAADILQVKTHRLAHPCSQHAYGVPFGSADDLVQCRLLWTLFADVMRQHTGTGRGKLFSGAIGGPELAVRFQPAHVIPHSNFIVWSSGSCIDDARKLRRQIRDKMRNCRRLTLRLYPSVACYRLVSSDDLRAVLRYSFKTIDLAGAYVTAAERVNYEPDGMKTLNRDTNLFLNNLSLLFNRLPRVARYGRCHAGHRDYLGHVTAWRQAQRDRNAERRQKSSGGVEIRVDGSNPIPRRLSSMETWEQFVRLRGGHVPRPHHSRFFYWNEAFMRRTRPPAWPPRQLSFLTQQFCEPNAIL